MHIFRTINPPAPAFRHASVRSRFVGKRPSFPGLAHNAHPLIFYHYMISKRDTQPPTPDIHRCASLSFTDYIGAHLWISSRMWMASFAGQRQARPFSRWPLCFFCLFVFFIRTTAEIPGEVIAVSVPNTCQYAGGFPILHPSCFLFSGNLSFLYRQLFYKFVVTKTKTYFWKIWDTLKFLTHWVTASSHHFRNCSLWCFFLLKAHLFL